MTALTFKADIPTVKLSAIHQFTVAVAQNLPARQQGRRQELLKGRANHYYTQFAGKGGSTSVFGCFSGQNSGSYGAWSSPANGCSYLYCLINISVIELKAIVEYCHFLSFSIKLRN